MKKTNPPRKPITRRRFLGMTAAAGATLAMPMFIPSRLLGADAPSNRVRVGQIGCGRIATGHDMPGVFKSGLADYVAVCDLDSKRRCLSPKTIHHDTRRGCVAAGGGR
jgi:myo-inositol 2-dehydrogenase / D-chiro-inositol 1-dehydrogenase